MLYRIYDPQCERYLGDWEIFPSIRSMVDRLADYHDIDWDWDWDWDYVAPNKFKTFLERLDYEFKTDQKRLEYLCDYWERDIQEYIEWKNILYCDVCQTAHVVLNREIDDDYYMCTMCKDNKKKDWEENKMLNTFLPREVLDFNS